MSLAGYACAWHYRNMISTDVRRSLSHVWWPLLGAGFMTFIGIFSIPTFDTVTLIIGVGGLAIDFVPLALFWSRKGAAFAT